MFSSHLIDPGARGELSPPETLKAAIEPAVVRDRRTGKFPKSARLLTSSHYKYLHRNASRHLGEAISIDFRQGRSFKAKLGITVSKKFGKAHERNRFKRVVREAFRELYQVLPNDLELNVSPRMKGTLFTKQAVLLELQLLLAKICRF